MRESSLQSNNAYKQIEETELEKHHFARPNEITQTALINGYTGE